MPPRSRDSYDHTHAAADSLGTRWSLIHRFPSLRGIRTTVQVNGRRMHRATSLLIEGFTGCL